MTEENNLTSFSSLTLPSPLWGEGKDEWDLFRKLCC